MAETTVRAAREGDSVAFDELLRPLLEPAFRLATSILRDEGAAEDAVQEAAIKAWRRIGQLREPDRVRSWFLGIVVNECRMARRRHWWSVIRQPEVDVRGTDPGEQATRSLDLGRALATLSEEERAALFLYYWLDLPLQEVAAATGDSLGTVKSRIYRAARRLRPGLALEEALDR
jgi:RNA polymerase sigma-70 factor (ECF subfamily)